MEVIAKNNLPTKHKIICAVGRIAYLVDFLSDLQPINRDQTTIYDKIIKNYWDNIFFDEYCVPPSTGTFTVARDDLLACGPNVRHGTYTVYGNNESLTDDFMLSPQYLEYIGKLSEIDNRLISKEQQYYNDIKQKVFYVERQWPINSIRRYNYMDIIPKYDISYSHSFSDNHRTASNKSGNKVNIKGAEFDQLVYSLYLLFTGKTTTISQWKNTQPKNKSFYFRLPRSSSKNRLYLIFNSNRCIDNINVDIPVTFNINTNGCLVIDPYKLYLQAFPHANSPQNHNVNSYEDIIQLMLTQHFSSIYHNYKAFNYALRQTVEYILKTLDRDIIWHIYDDEISGWMRVLMAEGLYMDRWHVSYYFPRYVMLTVEEIKQKINIGCYCGIRKYDRLAEYDQYKITLGIITYLLLAGQNVGNVPKFPTIGNRLYVEDLNMPGLQETLTFIKQHTDVINNAPTYMSNPADHRLKELDRFVKYIFDDAKTKVTHTNTPTFTLMAGPPGTGKSTYLKTLKNTYDIDADQYAIEHLKHSDGRNFFDVLRDNITQFPTYDKSNILYNNIHRTHIMMLSTKVKSGSARSLADGTQKILDMMDREKFRFNISTSTVDNLRNKHQMYKNMCMLHNFKFKTVIVHINLWVEYYQMLRRSTIECRVNDFYDSIIKSTNDIFGECIYIPIDELSIYDINSGNILDVLINQVNYDVNWEVAFDRLHRHIHKRGGNSTQKMMVSILVVLMVFICLFFQYIKNFLSIALTSASHTT